MSDGGGGGGLVFPLTLWTSLVRDVKDKDEIPLSSPHGDRAIQAIAPLMHVSACTCLRSASLPPPPPPLPIMYTLCAKSLHGFMRRAWLEANFSEKLMAVVYHVLPW